MINKKIGTLAAAVCSSSSAQAAFEVAFVLFMVTVLLMSMTWVITLSHRAIIYYYHFAEWELLILLTTLGQ